ncbi:hypothetical protein HK102_000594 [Quaeritorhiza haematococci]|nr:hypothetical protein HK102_000594 [Quaeritorhiza haematococci]
MIQDLVLGYLFVLIFTLAPLMVHAVVVTIVVNEHWAIAAFAVAMVNSCGWLNAYIYWRQYSPARNGSKTGSSGLYGRSQAENRLSVASL